MRQWHGPLERMSDISSEAMAIRATYQQLVDAGVRFAIETPLPTVRFGDLALTSTRSADNTGVRVQVLRRQPGGSWLRIIDRPEVPQP